MVNSQVTAEIVDALKLDLNVDKIPSPVPVIEVGKRVKSGFCYSSQSSASGTMSITPATMQTVNCEWYLTGILISSCKDATCDVATGAMFVVGYPSETGVATNMLAMGILTTTAQTSQIFVTFANPIKMMRNTNIQSTNTYTAGTWSRVIGVWGFRDPIQ